MKIEDIENAAKENVEFQGNLDFGTIIENACRESFVEGAKWRINIVWHDINEKPEDGRIIVLLGKYRTMIIYGPNMMYYREAVIMDGGFLKWAYKEDLIPNMEE